MYIYIYYVYIISGLPPPIPIGNGTSMNQKNIQIFQGVTAGFEDPPWDSGHSISALSRISLKGSNQQNSTKYISHSWQYWPQDDLIFLNCHFSREIWLAGTGILLPQGLHPTTLWRLLRFSAGRKQCWIWHRYSQVLLRGLLKIHCWLGPNRNPRTVQGRRQHMFWGPKLAIDPWIWIQSSDAYRHSQGPTFPSSSHRHATVNWSCEAFRK